MPELPVVKPTKVVKVLKCVGFVKIRSKGSHAQYKRGNLLVTVPMHNRDLHKTTLKSISTGKDDCGGVQRTTVMCLDSEFK